jgi:hypothetical protein
VKKTPKPKTSKRPAEVSAAVPTLEAGFPVTAPAVKVRTRRYPARTLTGRTEETDPGAQAIERLQSAHVTLNRPAFDPFDGRAKTREASDEEAIGLELLTPEPGGMLRGGGEALQPDVAPGGLTPQQRHIEIDIIDTLEHPSMINLGASQLRMEQLQTLGILQPGMDAAQSIQADNSVEKMLAHQMVALHFSGMNMLKRAAGVGMLHEPDPLLALRYQTAAMRSFDGYREHALAMVKVKTKGKQTVVVQHVHVSEGGQAIVAGGDLVKGGGSGPGGKGSK